MKRTALETFAHGYALNVTLAVLVLVAVALPHHTPAHGSSFRPYATPAEQLQRQGDALMDDLRQARAGTSPAVTDLGVSR